MIELRYYWNCSVYVLVCVASTQIHLLMTWILLLSLLLLEASILLCVHVLCSVCMFFIVLRVRYYNKINTIRQCKKKQQVYGWW